MKLAKPRLPTMPDNPGRLRRMTAVLEFPPSMTVDDPTKVPVVSHSLMDTMFAVGLGLTMATDVTRLLVSSQMRLLCVARPASGTTASWSARPDAIDRNTAYPGDYTDEWDCVQVAEIQILVYDSAAFHQLRRSATMRFCVMAAPVPWKGFPRMSMPDCVPVSVFPSLLHSR